MTFSEVGKMRPMIEYFNCYGSFMVTNIPYHMIEGTLLRTKDGCLTYDFGKIYLN